MFISMRATNILVVEDDPGLSRAYKIILDAQGYLVQIAAHGQEALEQLQSFTPHLILLDLLMPKMDGLKFLQKYQPKDHPNVKVLLFTNMTSSPSVEKAMKLGIDSVVVKSTMTPKHLSNIIQEKLKSN